MGGSGGTSSEVVRAAAGRGGCVRAIAEASFDLAVGLAAPVSLRAAVTVMALEIGRATETAPIGRLGGLKAPVISLPASFADDCSAICSAALRFASLSAASASASTSASSPASFDASSTDRAPLPTIGLTLAHSAETAVARSRTSRIGSLVRIRSRCPFSISKIRTSAGTRSRRLIAGNAGKAARRTFETESAHSPSKVSR
mmetsp:Transcript_7488/g.19456  ORF Transcript_7488/g.19456 Transcript_7488/m.19456 type:complete len:201 (+) Transcript_7488:405-1007(+)